MNETEIKLVFKNKKEIISKLSPILSFDRKVFVHDRYYGRKKSDMNNKNDLIRIRKIGSNLELTYKGKAKINDNICKRKELTVKIDSLKNMEQIIKQLGFRKISECESKRDYYDYKQAKIVFSKFTLPTKLEFMEIEAVSKKNIEVILEKLNSLVTKAEENIFKDFDKIRKKTTY
jgi:predicted adenylyl cyclase CyaB